MGDLEIIYLDKPEIDKMINIINQAKEWYLFFGYSTPVFDRMILELKQATLPYAMLFRRKING